MEINTLCSGDGMVDMYVSDAYAPRACGFKSHLEHQFCKAEQARYSYRHRYTAEIFIKFICVPVSVFCMLQTPFACPSDGMVDVRRCESVKRTTHRSHTPESEHPRSGATLERGT